MSRKLIIQSGEQDDSWGTPKEVIDLVKRSVGPITLDMASNLKANEIIGARRFYSKPCPCPAIISLERNEVIWCNPPGPVEQVRWFWEGWLECIGSPRQPKGGFLIFNLDHWRTLSSPDTARRNHPFYVAIWPSRLKFVGAPYQYNHPSGLVLTEAPIGFDGNVVRW